MKINSLKIYFDCVNTLANKERVLFLGWNEVETKKPFVFYQYRPVVGERDTYFFWTFQFDENLKKGLLTCRKQAYLSPQVIQIESLKQFKVI